MCPIGQVLQIVEIVEDVEIVKVVICSLTSDLGLPTSYLCVLPAASCPPVLSGVEGLLALFPYAPCPVPYAPCPSAFFRALANPDMAVSIVFSPTQ